LRDCDDSVWSRFARTDYSSHSFNREQEFVLLGIDYINAASSLGGGPVRQEESLRAGIDPGDVPACKTLTGRIWWDRSRGYQLLGRSGCLCKCRYEQSQGGYQHRVKRKQSFLFHWFRYSLVALRAEVNPPRSACSLGTGTPR